MKREYPRAPLCGVGALIIDEDRILLARRGAPPSEGQWSIPGGLVEVGETLKQAVRREALEETDLEVRPVALVELLERIFLDEDGRAKYHYILADYLCQVIGGSPRAGSDASEVRWASKDELHLFDLPQVTLEAIHKAFDLKSSEESKR